MDLSTVAQPEEEGRYTNDDWNEYWGYWQEPPAEVHLETPSTERFESLRLLPRVDESDSESADPDRFHPLAPLRGRHFNLV